MSDLKALRELILSELIPGALKLGAVLPLFGCTSPSDTKGVCAAKPEYGHACYSADELAKRVRYPASSIAWDGWDTPDAPTPTEPWPGYAYTGPMPPLGCPPAERVEDGCCNSASYVALQGNTCCYTWCGEMACCGRPYVVAGTRLVAQVAARGDWQGREGAPSSLATTVAHAVMAASWRSDALDEHASVASFAQLALDLLQCAAPPALLDAALAAGRDEVRHALLSFSIAARLDGQVVGPATLPVRPAPPATMVSLATSTFAAGCVGESLAAAQLSLAASLCSDPVLKSDLAAMAQDEARHAALAWRIVKWTIQEGGEAVAAALQAQWANIQSTPPVVPHQALLAGLSATDAARGGRLTTSQALAQLERTMAEVVAPCTSALWEVFVEA